MNALNEVNKVIASVTYYPHRHSGIEQEEEWLTPERMAVSILKNVLIIIKTCFQWYEICDPLPPVSYVILNQA